MQTFMHELGHLLGLSDVDDENNLMNWGNSVGFSLNNKSLKAKNVQIKQMQSVIGKILLKCNGIV